MSDERGIEAAMPGTASGGTPASVIGMLVVLIGILRLVILLGWRDEGRPG